MFSVPYGDQPECQKKCSGTDFFAVKVHSSRSNSTNSCTCVW